MACRGAASRSQSEGVMSKLILVVVSLLAGCEGSAFRSCKEVKRVAVVGGCDRNGMCGVTSEAITYGEVQDLRRRIEERDKRVAELQREVAELSRYRDAWAIARGGGLDHGR